VGGVSEQVQFVDEHLAAETSMSRFHLTLLSNSSVDYYPENTVARFMTKLPNNIDLNGEWEVALSEISVPSRGPKAADIDIAQDFSAGRSDCLSPEGLRGRLCTGYHHTRQLVTTDRAVSITLQVSASVAAAKEGGARPIVAGQLQTYIELIDSLQGARETCAGP